MNGGVVALIMDGKTDQIRQNVQAVRDRIRIAADKAQRDPGEVKLIAVTKLMPVETIKAGFEAGLRCFGENYPEQAAEKISALEVDDTIEWHMIGHIQSRKARVVCQFFNMVHSVDRMKIARYLDRYAAEGQRNLPVLLEVNLSGEVSKYGWEASDELQWASLVPVFQEIVDLPNLEVRGLMSMPPFYDDPERTRPIYQRLRRLQQFLIEEIPKGVWRELSIGTSFDFDVAVEEGATMVRIGTEIFGQRPS